MNNPGESTRWWNLHQFRRVRKIQVGNNVYATAHTYMPNLLLKSPSVNLRTKDITSRPDVLNSEVMHDPSFPDGPVIAIYLTSTEVEQIEKDTSKAKPIKLKLGVPLEDLGVALHTALRKACDSYEASMLWNLISVDAPSVEYSPTPWEFWLRVISARLRSLGFKEEGDVVSMTGVFFASSMTNAMEVALTEHPEAHHALAAATDERYRVWRMMCLTARRLSPPDWLAMFSYVLDAEECDE